LGGNEVSLLELTNAESRNQKKAIWVLGRQHSGEVTSSFMVEGIINFLLSERPEAMFLMDHFYFKIVPMLNIDGVVHGNTRAELSGCDPNRKWADPSRIYQPIVYSIKKMIEKDST
jgi:murein tripeptide amidase MpaA